ncbi:MAG: ATP-binding protein [Candidatus Sumerlaeia bacterium]|nr:ATP-binding protein [Candidatus Sumerlaeia bacterium]
MGDTVSLDQDVVQLARLAMAGRPQDVHAFVQRLAHRYRSAHPELAGEIRALLQESPTRQSPIRRQASVAPVPVDLESRLHLLRVEGHPSVELEPIWAPEVDTALRQIVSERSREAELLKQGLSPTRSMILTGPPGVGKTLAARWLARELGRPLLTLDLSAVMSSYLGRTGANVRHVLDYAKGVDCVLLLDELDAIAKRRDDATDVGELKRLVTVLLQEIDDWPSRGLLIAATNHAELLDPAVWRRFEMRVVFPMPNNDAVDRAVEAFMGNSEAPQAWRDALAMTLRGKSFSDIERQVLVTRRAAVVRGYTMEQAIIEMLRDRIETLTRKERGTIALLLAEAGVSQRQVHDLTGVSRDTIRKRTKALPNNSKVPSTSRSGVGKAHSERPEEDYHA